MLTDKDQEKISEAVFLTAFTAALSNLRERGFAADTSFTGMIRAMTTVIRKMLEVEKD